MNWIRRHRPSPGTAFGAAALTIALGGVAFAAIPDSNGSIHGCYHKANGNLRVVESDADCRSNEQPISWNQQGAPPNAGGGRVIANNESVPTGGEALIFSVDGFFAMTLNCPTDPSAAALVTVDNEQSADLRVWVPSGHATIAPGGSVTLNLNERGLSFHFAGAGDRAVSGPLNFLRSTPGGPCYFAAQAKVNDV